MAKISLMTLTWNKWEYTINFMDSIFAHWPLDNIEILLLDNGSNQPPPQKVLKSCTKYVRLKENIGFGHGFNELAKLATGDYLCMCNNDIAFTGPPTLLEDFLSIPDNGILFVSGPNILSPSNKRIKPGYKILEIPSFTLPTPSAIGVFLPTELFHQVGKWGEEYQPAGGEDLDLCFKIWDIGKKVTVTERTWVKHRGKTTVEQLDWRKLWTEHEEIFRHKWGHRIR
jgi:GT2 family glycosyltransferase